MTPPFAPKKHNKMTYHGQIIKDPWYWLKDPAHPKVKDKDILDYLTSENDWYQAHLKPLKPLVDKIYGELKGRIKQDDEGVPIKDGAWFYQWKYNKGAEYKHWIRWQDKERPQVVLDEAARAKGHDFYNCRSYDISPNEKLIAWSEDKDGSERFKVFVKNIKSRDIIDQGTCRASGAIIWAQDNRGYFYVELNKTHRPFRVKFHKIGTPLKSDITLLEEKDDGFFVSISRTKSRSYLAINIGDHITSEVHLIDLSNPNPDPILMSARREGHEYDIDHSGNHFYIRSNRDHKNFSVFKVIENEPYEENWDDFVKGNDNSYIRGLQAFKKFITLEDRVKGLDQIKICPLAGGDSHYIKFKDATFCTGFGPTPEFDTLAFRISYTSMITPHSVYDYNTSSKSLALKKVQDIPSGYDPENYKTERFMAPARDGTLVPISIVYRKDYKCDGNSPLHLYGYGAYGLGMPPSFSTSRLSLLDRGFAYAIAHIRGGDELGYSWYENGKLKARLNTFHDFVDCAKFLTEKGFSRIGDISCSGGSAGGSLMGYVANSNPEIWKTIIFHVPFVDILNTMLDASLPLTPLEWPEWGNPLEDKEAFDFIKSYSPYDNIEAKNYPSMMITAGLNDPRVTYWEPAKWVAKLRDMKTDQNPLIFKTNMGAGHQGRSGRFEGLEEIAEEYAFLLNSFGTSK